MDFYNMLERARLESKKISKTNAVTSQLDYDIGKGNVHIGPSDYVEWLTDRKWAHIRLEGRTFGDVPLNIEMKLEVGDVPLNIEMKLEVWDSPNSAGVVIDAVRCCKLALENKLSGSLYGPSAYFMKSPPEQYRDDIARDKTEEFIQKYTEEFIQKYGRVVDLEDNGKKPKKTKIKLKVVAKPKSRIKGVVKKKARAK